MPPATLPSIALPFDEGEQPGEGGPSLEEPQPRPASACIEIQAVAQNPQLPNGCEITSLTTVLNHCGLDADKEDMARNWLPRADGFYGTDPEAEYMGYPDASGWYCYQRPILAAANGYLQAAGSPLRAQDKTGATREELKELLAAGTPVVFWSTVDLAWPRYSQRYAWTLDSETFVPYVNVHCMVLKGYDDERDVFLVADPLYYYSEIGQDWFMALFDAMGARAVVVV